MSNVCCKEFTGWFKSFTKIEKALAIVEAILLVVLILLLILLILHLIVCAKFDDQADDIQHTTTPSDDKPDQGGSHKSTDVDYPGEDIDFRPVNDSESHPTTESYVTASNTPLTNSHTASGNKSKTVTEPGVKCSWTPSAKTTAVKHYYEDGHHEPRTHTKTHNLNGTTHIFVKSSRPVDSVTTRSVKSVTDAMTTQAIDNYDELIRSDLSDGEEAEDEYRSYVTALVKLKPPKDVLFGCILTIITEYWTLTAATCIESIEEVDSLDSFVIMEQYGSDKREPLQTVEDVQIHPLYEGRNRSYDLAALKSAGSLIKGSGSLVQLASYLDYALSTIGESLTVLGYGAFRSVDKSPTGRSLRQATVHRLPARQCAGEAGGGVAAALRHLVPGRAVPRGACGAAPLCAGALFSRGLPCTYCAGTPLLRGSVLLAVMSDNPQCGVACEPTLYLSVAAVADWVDATVRGE